MIKTPQEIYSYAYDKGTLFPKDWNISKNFSWNEVFVNETKFDGVPVFEVFKNALGLAEHLQRIRTALNRPILVHSWVRSPKHNKRIGSEAKFSAHTNGCAVDFSIVNMDDNKLRKLILDMELPIRVEANTIGWVHIDISKYVAMFSVFKKGLFYA